MSLVLPTLTCQRCGYEWIPRAEAPKVCPLCHSPKWNRSKEPKEAEVSS